MPPTAIALVVQIQDQLQSLKDLVRRGHVGEELHALSAPCASHLGLYPTEINVTPSDQFSQETYIDALETINKAASSLRQSLERPDAQVMESQMKEVSAQATELARASRDVHTMTICAGNLPTSLPSALWVGAVAQDQTPPENYDDAVQVLEALCQALTPVCTELRLECFHERINAERQDPMGKTYTFTSGGRIIVLDFEFGLKKDESMSWRPTVSLQVSYASADGARIPEDKRLAELIASYLQQLLYLIFGHEADHDVLRRCASESSMTTYAQAGQLWRAFLRSLTALASIDRLEVTGSDGHVIDAFLLLEQFGQTAEEVCTLEAQTLCSKYGLSSSSPHHPEVQRYLLQEGLGVARHHDALPFLTLSFTPNHRAMIQVAPCSVPLASPAETSWIPTSKIELPMYARQPLSAFGQRNGLTRPLAYVAEVEPPIMVPHRIARDVYCACGLAQHHLPLSSKPSPSTSGYLTHILGSSSHYCASIQDEEARIISSLPFQSLVQLYHALNILREQVVWNDLLRRAAKSNTEGPTVTLKLEGAEEHGTSRLRLNMPTAHKGVVVNAILSRKTSEAHHNKWSLEAQAISLAGQPARVWGAPSAQANVPGLQDDGLSLTDLVDTLYVWARS